MIDCLLRDVRGNWADDPRPRVEFAMDLCYELGGDFKILGDDCKEFISWVNKDGKRGVDGRYFRRYFPYGYEDLDTIHGQSFTLVDKSQEIKRRVDQYITYPEYLFSDVEDKSDVQVLQRIK